MTLTRAVLCLWLGFLISCTDQPHQAAPLGEAYAGPSALNLRRELARNSVVSATVKHGDKLEILEYRHRLVKVRTGQGVEGWADLRELLMPEQMAALRQMSERAARYPSQGTATVFETLNMHTEPNRTSPSFWQIPENGKVDVLEHKLMPRIQRSELVAPPPVKAAPPRKRSKPQPSQARLTPPPPGPAPKPPDNWLALSVPKLESLRPPSQPAQQQPPPQAPAPPTPGPMDDWSLVRTPDGKAGWVLTRPLSMAIPDEVAQYAEGHRITSYFALGRVNDHGTVKNNWLWTTITKGQEPYEFDSFRVFVWSTRHHRYETAYIERNVVGHFPVQVDTSGQAPSFAVVLEGDDGHLYRKTYSFEGFRIRMINKQPSQEGADEIALPKTAGLPVQPPAPKRSLYTRFKDRVRRFFR